jgi:hypothetical protein
MKRAPEPSPYDDPFSGFNLLKYGPDEPINAIRPKPTAPPGTIFIADPAKHPCFAPPPAPAEPAQANGPGRPLTFDAGKQETFCVLVRAGCSRSAAARLINVSRQTVLNAIHANPDFTERVCAAERQGEALAYTNIARAGGTSWRASAWLVERRARARRRTRAPSVAAVLRNRRFLRELKNLIKQELAPPAPSTPAGGESGSDPYARPDLDEMLRVSRGSPAASAAQDSELAAVRSKLASQIAALATPKTNCAPRAQ